MKKTVLTTFAFSVLLCVKINAQIITTIAGNGTIGYSGNGGAATAAELNSPVGVATDASGNIYIADELNNVIRKVGPSGIITTIAGNSTSGYSGDGGIATAAELHFPTGVATDASGNIYITDELNNVIRKISPSGIITTIAGNGTQGYSGDGGAATAAELNTPFGAVAVDAFGNVYVADAGNSRIRKINSFGTISTIAGTGTAGYNGDGIAATSAELSYSAGVAIDASGNVFIADSQNNRIRKIDSSGIITTIAGDSIQGYNADGGAATAAELYLPYGVAVDNSGNLYISDYGNGRIRKVTTSGIISTIAGNGTPGYAGDGGDAWAAELNGPFGVDLDASGNVYIADANNNRIREITIATGIATLTQSLNISLYPNPATTNLSLCFTMQGKATDAIINILNVIGKSMLETSTEINNEKTLPIDISQFSSGVYFVKITTAISSQVIKFVKLDR